MSENGEIYTTGKKFTLTASATIIRYDFTPSNSPNFNSFSKKKTQKMSENGEIYTTGKNFTLPPALTAWTNSTSAVSLTEKKLPAMVWGVGCGVSS